MDIIGLIPSFGGLLYTLAAFVVALSVIVAVHEYGHYIVGRWSGIKAEVFSIGFGPVLFSRMDRHGTRWQVAALPFGGYVKFLGDASAVSDKADEAVMSAARRGRAAADHAWRAPVGAGGDGRGGAGVQLHPVDPRFRRHRHGAGDGARPAHGEHGRNASLGLRRGLCRAT
jgi:membrane-associated protease RseP (regulator of RpoE activity)